MDSTTKSPNLDKQAGDGVPCISKSLIPEFSSMIYPTLKGDVALEAEVDITSTAKQALGNYERGLLAVALGLLGGCM